MKKLLLLAILSAACLAAKSGTGYTVKRMNVSAYCPCKSCCGKDINHPAYKITASGHKIQPGDVLVAAPKSYKFGTVMEIPGYNDGKPVKVLDRGGAIKGDKLDLLFSSHSAALKWGRKQVDVKVYE